MPALKLPPIPDNERAALDSLRMKLQAAGARWGLKAAEVADLAGIPRGSVQRLMAGAPCSPRTLTPSGLLRAEAAISAIVRREARVVLAQVDPEFAAWDEPRLRAEAEERLRAAERTEAEARRLAEERLAP